MKSHGRSYTSEYYVWQAMKARCKNPNNKQYADYGGRGITVCEEWKNSFATFFADMGQCPESYCIDRTDNNLGYSKDNCKWVTRDDNAKNKRNNIHITENGITYILKDYCTMKDLNYRTVCMRIKMGKTPEEAVAMIWPRIACTKGHPYTEETTIFGKRGNRYCRICLSHYEKHRRVRNR